MACLSVLAESFLRRCRACAHGSPSGRCVGYTSPESGVFAEHRPTMLNFVARMSRGGLPNSYRRVQLALVNTCPGYQSRSVT